MTEYQQRDETFSALGSKYDLSEGIYGSAGWKGLCQFLELDRTPICCAVPKNHPLCYHTQISMQDLDDQSIVMPIEGVSEEMDAFRNYMIEHHPATMIIDSSYYGVDTFTLCEMNSYILITHPVYKDISFFIILNIIPTAINAVTTSEHACDTKTPVYPNTFDMIKSANT